MSVDILGKLAPGSATPVFDRFRPHPWHGLSWAESLRTSCRFSYRPRRSMLPNYETDKLSGYLRVNRLRHNSFYLPFKIAW